MKKLLALFVLVISVFSLEAMMRADVGVEAEGTVYETDEDGIVEEVWVGPGFYYGIWFDNETDYHHHHRHHGGGRHHHGGGRHHHGGGRHHHGGGRRH